MVTIAAIAKSAFDAVALAVTGAIHSASLSYLTQGAYDAVSGSYAVTRTFITGGRGVMDTAKPVKDLFPSYTVGPSDKLILLEGFTDVPAEGWTLTLKDQDYVVKAVQDIVLANSLFYVIVIKSDFSYMNVGYYDEGYFE